MKLPVVLLFAFSVSAVHAEELEVEPGLWETSMTQNNPVTGEPMTNTFRTCVESATYDPEALMQEAQGCDVTQNDASGGTLRFRMTCDMKGAQALVNGTYKVTGNSGVGNMDMNMKMGAFSMDMKMNWTSTRVGDCKPGAE